MIDRLIARVFTEQKDFKQYRCSTDGRTCDPSKKPIYTCNPLIIELQMRPTNIEYPFEYISGSVLFPSFLGVSSDRIEAQWWDRLMLGSEVWGGF